ncbi:hypothetical protein FN846DRAFT_889984 [Sphaerosporella brunnea]|uniref:Uncharacterized protein n=1 Tax=Sphaerosporella brunnea TaxID=1250544 RepID=A0A5J5EXI5_9PEZI|nr:hypothetical protein FN846DRAFT_889984 [Sphaerosporella brunnea]
MARNCLLAMVKSEVGFAFAVYNCWFLGLSCGVGELQPVCGVSGLSSVVGRRSVIILKHKPRGQEQLLCLTAKLVVEDFQITKWTTPKLVQKCPAVAVRIDDGTSMYLCMCFSNPVGACLFRFVLETKPVNTEVLLKTATMQSAAPGKGWLSCHASTGPGQLLSPAGSVPQLQPPGQE